jgi:ribonuclease BN (tRNA processing enzyme)
MIIHPFGTNGFFESFGRQTACYVIPRDKKLIILDAGSGLFRFAEPFGKDLLKNADSVDILLSHYHLDHTFGFYAAFNLLNDKKVTVYGMKKKKVFESLTHDDYFPVNYDEQHKNWRWDELKIGETTIGDYRVMTRPQFHRGAGSLGLRLEFSSGKTVSYVTDGEPTMESAEFVRGSDVLLHEHGESGKELFEKKVGLEGHILGGHTTTIGAALVARETGVKKLILVHHDPFKDNEELNKLETLAQGVFKESYLGKDLEEINF